MTAPSKVQSPPIATLQGPRASAKARALGIGALLASTLIIACGEEADGDMMGVMPGPSNTSPTPGPSNTSPTPGPSNTSPTPGPSNTSPMPDPSGTAPVPTQPQPFGPAPQLFANNCALCHGAEGLGVNLLGPELRHPVADFFTWIVRNGRFGTAMASYDESLVPEADLQEMITWLSSAPQPVTGEELYGDYCAACHGDDAAGGPTMRELKSHVGEFLSNVRAGSHAGDFGNRTEYMPAWTADQLSDAEVQLIADYVGTL